MKTGNPIIDTLFAGEEVRFVAHKGERWLVAADVIAALGLPEYYLPEQFAAESLVVDGTSRAVLSPAAVMCLAFYSSLPSALELQIWAVECLCDIAKFGCFVAGTPQEKLAVLSGYSCELRAGLAGGLN